MKGTLRDLRPVRLAYQPPASSTFLSQQISHQQPTSSTFLSEQISTSHQPPAKRTGCRVNSTLPDSWIDSRCHVVSIMSKLVIDPE
jgi:hypothetical protein